MEQEEVKGEKTLRSEKITGTVPPLRGRLRLYCLYVDSTIVCFGSGGYKPPEIRAYQEDAELNKKVEQMKAVAKRINKAIVEKDIEIKDGKLKINFWDYED